MKPDTKVIGVQAEGTPSMYLSWKKKEIVELEKIETIADGITVKKPGELTFSILRKHIDDIVLVNNDEIRQGVRVLFNDFKVVSEFAGATAISAVISGKMKAKNKKLYV